MLVSLLPTKLTVNQNKCLLRDAMHENDSSPLNNVKDDTIGYQRIYESD